MPSLLLNPYLSRNNLASHVVPLIAGHSGIILRPPLLSVFRDSLSPSSAWLGPFPGLPAMGRIHQYTLSAFTAPAPTATCQHVTSSYMHIICIHSTSTYTATFQHHMHHTERAPIQHQHLLHNILCSNGTQSQDTYSNSTLLVITAAVPEARAFSKYCYWTCKHNEVLFSLVCSFKISERPPKDLPLCPSSHCRFRGHNVRPRNQR